MITLESDVNSIIYYLQQGKPDTRAPLDPSDKTGAMRPRVLQSPQKEGTCLHYAINILRDRIGPNLAEKFPSKRKIEIICSNYRKGVTHICVLKDVLKGMVRKLKELNYVLSRQEIKESVMPQLQANPTIDPEMDSLGITDNEMLIVMQKFVDQSTSDNFEDFYPEGCKELEFDVIDKFYSNLGRSAYVEHLRRISEEGKYLLLEMYPDKSEHELSFLNRQYVERELQNFTPADQYEFTPQKCLIEAYGLIAANWNPLDDISHLIAILKERGPLLILGYLGTHMYNNPAMQFRTISTKHPITEQLSIEIPIYSWSAEDHGPIEQKDPHAIVLVGASRDTSGEEAVYFVDPCDGSDPNDPLKQKIYKIPYHELTGHICSQFGYVDIHRTTKKVCAYYYERH